MVFDAAELVHRHGEMGDRQPFRNNGEMVVSPTAVPTLVEQAQLIRDMGWGEFTIDGFQGL